jgi:hypothetical protein
VDKEMNDYWFCYEPRDGYENEWKPVLYVFDPVVRDLNRPPEGRSPRKGLVKLQMSEADAIAPGILDRLSEQYPLPKDEASNAKA